MQHNPVMFRRRFKTSRNSSSHRRDTDNSCNEAVATIKEPCHNITTALPPSDCNDTNASTADLYRATCLLSPISRFHLSGFDFQTRSLVAEIVIPINSPPRFSPSVNLRADCSRYRMSSSKNFKGDGKKSLRRSSDASRKEEGRKKSIRRSIRSIGSDGGGSEKFVSKLGRESEWNSGLQAGGFLRLFTRHGGRIYAAIRTRSQRVLEVLYYVTSDSNAGDSSSYQIYRGVHRLTSFECVKMLRQCLPTFLSNHG